MVIRLRLTLAAAAGMCLVATAAAAASWRGVPGAPDVEIDLASVQVEQTRVIAWVRWWGRHPLAPELARLGPQAPRVHRTALRTEFDCARRTVRVLGTNAYDSGGTATFMSSVPGQPQPVNGQEMGWAYDAMCEAARSERRL